MANLGIHVKETGTAVSIPVVADSGIPYVVGTSPIHMAAKPGKVNYPILATSWDEAVEKLGYNEDWKNYTLCEAIHSHFQLYGCQPVIFCNVLNPEAMKEDVASDEYTVEDHRITLPFELIQSTLSVTNAGAKLNEDEDYTVLYDSDDMKCYVELLESGSAYAATSLTAVFKAVKPSSVTVSDIAEGIALVDQCMTAVGKIPDILLAPGWSHNTTIAALLATKADRGIMGLFGGKALIDIDCTEEGVTEYSALARYKIKNNFVDPNEIVCWPMVTLGERRYHLSTQLAGLMAKVDTDNVGCPYESPSNKVLKIDGCCLADGSEVNLSWPQTNIVAGDYGVVTVVNFMNMGWTAKGNYTACYPANTDVKDQFIPVSRMFNWVGNTLIHMFWSKLDTPMNRRLIDNILDTCNIWLGGLVGTERLLGGRAEMLESENNLLDLMAGILHIHIYITPPSPMQECDFTLEYDTAYAQAALQA